MQRKKTKHGLFNNSFLKSKIYILKKPKQNNNLNNNKKVLLLLRKMSCICHKVLRLLTIGHYYVMCLL